MEPEVKEFVEAVGAIIPPPNPIFRRQSYFALNGKFMIVKISRSKKPFWGLTKKYADLLNQLDQYYLVLLTSGKEGYFFTKTEINRNIDNGHWGLSNGQYKINSPLPDRNSFLSHSKFIEKSQI